ncbi:Protein of unknown function DUF947 [Ostreococcus tauri]|uniref:rRNA biogenesis protein RRP36 n=1 Tax=Ostreococcus tauri TaxID=70448 RepID=A0A090M759_OSTTA|nr:Protein of unknown function DUF947 [Ostreococcus tauri]CEG00932.1 Protein of unknown function DUF947 [Ostreococcus tauri]|eukprot:XP_003074816.2 Protein of unknown function DUF947 [Ostreococcus tauri]
MGQASASSGKRKYHMKSMDVKILKLIKKYEQLKKNGALEKNLERKRKKNASKQRKLIPKSKSTT